MSTSMAKRLNYFHSLDRMSEGYCLYGFQFIRVAAFNC